MSIPNEDFHEVWWIYAQERHPWGGTRIAHFRKSADGVLLVIIMGETDLRRVGMRIWDDIALVEGWVKIKQIPLPSREDVEAAIDSALRGVAAKVMAEHFK